MRIDELNIIEFGGLSDRHYKLSEGLNIFEGDNEAGKSTLWLFIKFMLYGMPKKGHPERQKSVSRTSHTASGTMTVIKEGETYRIERSFSENSKSKATVYRISDGEKVFVGEEPGEALLGVTKDIFENSVSVGQTACASLGGEKGAAAIRNILSSANEDVDIDKIQKKLDSIRVYYRHRNGKGGKLFELAQDISLLEGRLEKATESRLKITDIEKKLNGISENVRNTEEELKAVAELNDTLQRQEILSRFDRLAESRQQLSELCEARDDLVKSEAKNGHLPTAADAASLAASANSCARAESAKNDADARLTSITSEKRASESRAELISAGKLIENGGGAEKALSAYAKAGAQRVWGISLAGVGAVLLIASVALILSLSKLFAISAAVSAVLMIVGIAVSLSGVSKGKAGVLSHIQKGADVQAYINECVEAYKTDVALSAELTKAEAEKKSAEEHCQYLYGLMEAEMKRLYSTLPVSIDNARAEAIRLNGFVERHRRYSEKAEALRGLIEGEEKILSVYDEKALRDAFAVSGMPSLSREEADKKKRFYEERLRTLRQRDKDLRTELINLKALSDDPTALRDELLDKKKQYAEAEEYYNAVVTAIDGIERAASAMRGNITPAIGQKAAELIGSICDEKYTSVMMGRDMELSLIDKNGTTTTVDMMSGGMKDAAYIALRIALMLRIFGGDTPPLMLDEALCQLDDGRMKRILEILSRLCQMNAQCILFTCHKREAIACRELGIKAEIFKM